MLRRICLTLTMLLMVGSGCATAQVPSSVQARQPSPSSITRDKPGGDAVNPTDAALERLLAEPIGKKVDRWHTIGAKFPDVKNWKRVRFWGYPTRAGFRYGKDPSIAIGVLSYTDAEGDDSPAACLKAFVGKARETAELFDVNVGDVRREAKNHKRGPERVDWKQAAAEWEVEKLRRAEERKKRIAKLRKAKLARLKKSRERWRKRRAAIRAKKAAAKRAAAARKAGQKPADKNAAKAGAGAKDNPPMNAADAPPNKQIPPTKAAPNPSKGESKSANEDGANEDGANEDGAGAAKKRAVTVKRRQIFRMKVDPKKLKILKKRQAEARKARIAAKKRAADKKAAAKKQNKTKKTTPSKPETAEAQKRRLERERLTKQRRERVLAQPYRRVPVPKNMPSSEMAVLRSSGKFNTLFKRDHYEVAVVAYESWPGTCLVQGFAVRVGSDVMLARRVVTRWVDDAAPILHWAGWLREAPPFENR